MKGWHNDNYRHSLAARRIRVSFAGYLSGGIKTASIPIRWKIKGAPIKSKVRWKVEPDLWEESDMLLRKTLENNMDIMKGEDSYREPQINFITKENTERPWLPNLKVKMRLDPYVSAEDVNYNPISRAKESISGRRSDEEHDIYNTGSNDIHDELKKEFPMIDWKPYSKPETRPSKGKFKEFDCSAKKKYIITWDNKTLRKDAKASILESPKAKEAVSEAQKSGKVSLSQAPEIIFMPEQQHIHEDNTDLLRRMDEQRSFDNMLKLADVERQEKLYRDYNDEVRRINEQLRQEKIRREMDQ